MGVLALAKASAVGPSVAPPPVPGSHGAAGQAGARVGGQVGACAASPSVVAPHMLGSHGAGGQGGACAASPNPSLASVATSSTMVRGMADETMVVVEDVLDD